MEDALKREGRPRSVRLFEATSIIWAVANSLWRAANPLWRAEDDFGELALLLVAVGLTLWVTRGRSRVARALYTLYGLLNLVILGYLSATGAIPADAQSTMALLVGVLFEIVLLSLLWWPATTAWLKRRNFG